jgi:hypothetical protein
MKAAMGAARSEASERPQRRGTSDGFNAKSASVRLKVVSQRAGEVTNQVPHEIVGFALRPRLLKIKINPNWTAVDSCGGTRLKDEATVAFVPSQPHKLLTTPVH